ncbi:MAG: SagB/ThcOx family dehydrogenase [Muribaculaceae bacterium]|nr:SagB/ThcOx family dehydrogenase [Muribaculaceae bacterium]
MINKVLIPALVVAVLGIGAYLAVTFTASAADIELPAPQTSGGMSLMDALANRKSTREFDPEKRLSEQQLSDLLWAACGFNREDKLTVPTALNRQELSLYVIMTEGAYFYDNKANKLVLVTDEDIRLLAGKQEFAQKAPLNIAIVSDMEKMPNDIFAGTDAGAVMQNIYLWCAANGVGTVTRGSFDADALSKALRLDANKRIILVQTVGY